MREARLGLRSAESGQARCGGERFPRTWPDGGSRVRAIPAGRGGFAPGLAPWQAPHGAVLAAVQPPLAPRCGELRMGCLDKHAVEEAMCCWCTSERETGLFIRKVNMPRKKKPAVAFLV